MPAVPAGAAQGPGERAHGHTGTRHGHTGRQANRPYLRPVLPVCIALMAGIELGVLFPGHGEWGWAAAEGGLAVCICLLVGARTARTAPLVLFVAVGYLLIQPWIAPRLPASHVSRYVGAVPWEICAVVAGEPVSDGHRTRLVLSVETLQGPKEGIPATGRIRLTIAGRTPALAPGDRIRFTSRLQAPRNFNNPGAFDYRRYLAFQGIRATAFCHADRVRILKNSSATGVRPVLGAMRASIRGQIAAAATRHDTRGLLEALILGDRAGVSAELRDTFNRAGVSHLLAISGLHVGIVAAGAFWLFASALAFVRPLLWRGSAKRWAAWLTLFPVVLYGLLAGMPPSTQRAVVMVSVFLAAVWFDREQDPLNTLSVAALLILAVHPPALFSVSFQLSFSAVTAIVLGVTGWPRPDVPAPGLRARLRHRVGMFFLVSALAILGTLPLVMRYFNQASLAALPANAVAVPLIGGCAVPAGLFSALLGFVWPAAAVWGFSASAWVLELALPAIHWLSAFPWAAVRTVTPSLWEIAGYYAILGAALGLLKAAARRRRSRPPPAAGAPLRKAAWVLAALGVSAAAVDTAYWLHTRFWHRDLRATVIDVGQGSATLLEFPRGPVMLVDGGGFPDPMAFDVGARVVAPFLWRKKIRTVDIIVLSHPDADHLNGLLYIAEHFHVKQLWSTGDQAHIGAYRRLLEVAAKKGVTCRDFSRLARIHDINGAQVEILHPPGDFRQTSVTDSAESRNDNSIVVRVSLGPHSLLMPGDLMAEGEARLVLAHGDALGSTVLLAPHHGSRTSSTTAFLERVSPAAAIVSAADSGRTRHPHPTVLDRYTRRGTQVFCTAAAGAVQLSFDRGTLRILPFLECAGGGCCRP